ncbi:MAG: ribbon-helix-helix protein, CopG family [Deltaproteobacteria bacterium]|nr:ribbon-helix-helix protein, CopG family [Deltaproteobacteria bacterium]
MAVAKIAISLPAPLVTRIDRLAKKAGLSRSALVREVVEKTLNESADTEIVRKARRIYAQIGEEDRALAETFLPIVAEAVPSRRRRRR